MEEAYQFAGFSGGTGRTREGPTGVFPMKHIGWNVVQWYVQEPGFILA